MLIEILIEVILVDLISRMKEIILRIYLNMIRNLNLLLIQIYSRVSQINKYSLFGFK